MYSHDRECTTHEETNTWARRIDNQDKKLDALLKKQDNMIRIEERHTALLNRVDIGDAKIHKHANLLMVLDHKASLNAKTVKSVEKFFWITIASGLSLVAFILKDNIYHHLS